MDGCHRRGKLPDRKAEADEAVEAAAELGQQVDKVLVWRRYPDRYLLDVAMVENRDYFVNELLPGYHGQRVAPASMPAGAPLFLTYSSGTTGRPKGCQHSTGGYLSYVARCSKEAILGARCPRRQQAANSPVVTGSLPCW